MDAGYRMHTRYAGFPVAGLGLRYSVFGPRRESGTRYRVPGVRYRAPDSVFGLRFSALGLDKECGKVVSPLPLIPPWPRTEHRAPKTEPGPWKTRPSGLHPASWESRTQAIAYCPTALLPYCLTALLPYCLTALLPYCLPAPHRFDPADGSGYDRGRSQPGPGSPYWGEKGKGCKSPAVPPP